jgi:AcrR family transcriptional regulator
MRSLEIGTPVVPGEPVSTPNSQEQAPARDRSLRAAEELFAEEGFDRTPGSKIAKSASVPQGLIFYHFPTKMDLLLSLVRDYATVFVTGLADPAGERSNGEDAITTVIEDLWKGIQDRLQRYTRIRKIVFQELAAHPEIRQQAQELQTRGTSVVAVRLARATGHPEPQPARVMAGRLDRQPCGPRSRRARRPRLRSRLGRAGRAARTWSTERALALSGPVRGSARPRPVCADLTVRRASPQCLRERRPQSSSRSTGAAVFRRPMVTRVRGPG